ncbi:PREDICTED: ribosomal RNA-processing protein 17 [Ipomoea nil]|uniref:ribosomal RNA-processing protein 17 n=1 Tax=Ipomoea nil TaxID=35883 RepID=UPI000900E04F|nr:PREDICTED: ribosomal RNA-processing protein 17 [Ipomoea nil]
MATMEQGKAEEAEQRVGSVRGRHIKKRALKNKSLSVSFDEKDLQEYVTGFHKRKKKRRKEAQKQLQETERRKRIEARKKRRLEREFAVHGGVPPESAAESVEHEEDEDDEEDTESNGPNAPVSGTTMYDNGDVQVTVTTSEISHEQEFPALRPPPAAPELSREIISNRGSIPVSKKKPFKKAVKRKSKAKPQNKRDKKKGKVKNKKH